MGAIAWQVLAAQVFAAMADWRVSRPCVRQSTAQSRHQLLPSCGARGAGAPMSPTAAVHRPRPSSIEPRRRERHAVAQVATGASCIDARSTPVSMASASAHQQQLCGCHRMAGACSPGLRCHGRLACVEAVRAPINSPVTSSAPALMWCTWRRCSDVAHSSRASASSVFDRAAAPLVCLEHQASQQSARSKWR